MFSRMTGWAASAAVHGMNAGTWGLGKAARGLNWAHSGGSGRLFGSAAVLGGAGLAAGYGAASFAGNSPWLSTAAGGYAGQRYQARLMGSKGSWMGRRGLGMAGGMLGGRMASGVLDWMT